MSACVLGCLYVFKKGKTAESKVYGWSGFKSNNLKVLTYFAFSK